MLSKDILISAISPPISGNIFVNNGQVDSNTGFGIIAYPVDGLIVSENICENDSNLPNPYEKIGIIICAEANGYSTTKSIIINNNICRNNLSSQIVTEYNGSCAYAIAVFEGNIQKGPGAIQRREWHDQRSIFLAREFQKVKIVCSGRVIINKEIKELLIIHYR